MRKRSEQSTPPVSMHWSVGEMPRRETSRPRRHPRQKHAVSAVLRAVIRAVAPLWSRLLRAVCPPTRGQMITASGQRSAAAIIIRSIFGSNSKGSTSRFSGEVTQVRFFCRPDCKLGVDTLPKFPQRSRAIATAPRPLASPAPLRIPRRRSTQSVLARWWRMNTILALIRSVLFLSEVEAKIRW